MPNITFYAPVDLEQRLRQRGLGNGGNVVARDLERYYDLIAVAAQTVRGQLSEEEFNFLCDALHGLDVPRELLPHLQQVVLGAVGDARADGLDERWGVDAEALAEKLSSFSRRELIALLDEVEQFWESQRE